MSTKQGITFRLPCDPLTKLDDTTKPTAVAVRLLCKEMYHNAMSVPSTLGGGRHGHLGMVMPEVEYMKISLNKTKYKIPTKPDIPSFNEKSEVRDKQSLEYQQALNEYTEAQELQAHLLQLLLQAVPRLYILSLSHSTLGFTGITPKRILKHLMANYGVITPQDLKDNLSKLETPWNPETPIEMVFTNAIACREFAEQGQEPIPDTAYMRAIVDVFRASGAFPEAIREWEFKPAAERIVDKIEAHFIQADNYRRDSEELLKTTMAASASANAANQARTPTPPPVTDRNQRPDFDKGHPSLFGFAYCWTHGICTHSGKDCRQPAEGHIKEATCKKRKGGAETIWNPQRVRQERRSKRPRNDLETPDGR